MVPLQGQHLPSILTKQAEKRLMLPPRSQGGVGARPGERVQLTEGCETRRLDPGRGVQEKNGAVVAGGDSGALGRPRDADTAVIRGCAEEGPSARGVPEAELPF